MNEDKENNKSKRLAKDSGLDKESAEAMTQLFESQDFWEYSDQMVDTYILVKGKAFDKTPYWAYMRVPPSKMVALKDAMDREQNNLLDYGFILAIGYDEDPPEDVKQEMEKSFPISHNFEEEFEQEVVKLHNRMALKDKYKSKGKQNPED